MKTQAEKIYADILPLSPSPSQKHPPMSMHDRAAQFSYFAALDTHEEAIRDATVQAEISVDNRVVILNDGGEI